MQPSASLIALPPHFLSYYQHALPAIKEIWFW